MSNDNIPEREAITEKFGLNAGALAISPVTLTRDVVESWISMGPLVVDMLPGALALLVEFDEKIGEKYSNGEKMLAAMLIMSHLADGTRVMRKQHKTDAKFEEIMAKAAENGENGES